MHVNALTGKTTVDALSLIAKAALSCSPADYREEFERSEWQEAVKGERTRRIKGGRNADEKRGRVEEGRGSSLMNSNI